MSSRTGSNAAAIPAAGGQAPAFAQAKYAGRLGDVIGCDGQTVGVVAGLAMPDGELVATTDPLACWFPQAATSNATPNRTTCFIGLAIVTLLQRQRDPKSSGSSASTRQGVESDDAPQIGRLVPNQVPVPWRCPREGDGCLKDGTLRPGRCQITAISAPIDTASTHRYGPQCRRLSEEGPTRPRRGA
jgi:hypothetical protein